MGRRAERAYRDRMAGTRTKWSPADFMLFGLLFAVVAGMIGGALIVAGPDWIGWAFMGALGFVGQTLFAIGVIAKGVQVGRR